MKGARKNRGCPQEKRMIMEGGDPNLGNNEISISYLRRRKTNA